MAKILVVDDDAAFREGMLETLNDLGQSAMPADKVSDALRLLKSEKFDAVFLDFRMPEINGIDAIKMILETVSSKDIAIVMITAFVDSANTIAAMRLGAFDHLTKPVSRKDIERVVDGITKHLRIEPAVAVRPMPTSVSQETLVGHSAALRDVLKMIGRLAATDSSVLITGETGTGKELVARAIHQNSARAKFSLVTINCAAIPETLLESELFGHAKGAFTGAISDRKGSFQQADGGTLLLDEIGDMKLSLQAKLLRALQEKEVTPVGSSRPVSINVRFLAATHQSLAALVAAKEFREDLFYRLNVVELHLPPLRDRREDIPDLISHFLSRFPGQRQLSAEALAKMEAHRWPGNVRELRNVVERASVMARSRVISESEIRFLSDDSLREVEGETSLDLPQAIAQLERQMITRALQSSNGNRSEAARKLGIQRQLLYAKLKEYLIESP